MQENIEVRRKTGYTVLQDSFIEREDLTSSEKLAYIALCRYADKAGECWPSYATIAKCMSASRRTAMRAVQSLVDKGLVAYQEQKDASGDPTSNLYTINDAEEGVVTESHQGGDTVSPGVVTECHPKDSHLKDYQGRGDPPPFNDSPPISREDLQEWTEDYSDLPLQVDDASLANLNRLPYCREDIRAALIAWLPTVRRKAPRLGWFLNQAGGELEQAKREREQWERERQRTEEFLEQDRREREAMQNRTPEEEADAKRIFEQIKERFASSA